MKSQDLIKEIREYIEKARALMPEVTNEMLYTEGTEETIFYMNGNDGTDFDWRCNNRLCEFMVFYKSTEMGFVKVFVNSNGTMDGYVYKEDYKPGDKPIKLEPRIIGENDALYFAALMYHVADEQRLFDKGLDKLNFDHEVSVGELYYMKPEKEEW